MIEPRPANSCADCGRELSRERVTDGLCPGCLMELGLESPEPVDAGQGPEESETLAYRPERLAEGQVLGNRYRIRALLGRGGMGEVWRAVDLKLRVEVALKALRGRLLTDERALETLRQEVRMAREVVSPNVCRVFDLVELEGKELVSMEYIDGITLWDVLRARAPLPLSEARGIAAQFLAGLEAIHDAGLVHRDVKPENLMMTRSGRVVLMDFGIAKALAEGSTVTVSGTPAYMAPEQARGEAADARADVFSAGVVLAEMVAPGGLATLEARQAVWQGIHSKTPELPATPWAPVLVKAVAHHPEHRFPTATALARALEEVTLRVERAEDVTPYPGLASFTQENADYFFGRELEVEEMWKKLRRPHLLGLIGPSGAGKSSFLRAGLLAVTPTGWRAVVTTPGTQPFANLARVLVPEVSGDTEALQLLVDADDLESVSKVVSSWRQRHDQVLIVFDQFEELFTLNPPEVQEHFATLVGRLALEADAHVLLAMRDDFLFHCQDFESLSPVFSELTPIGAPKGTALRRALVQPALKCGYRFEDDSLVDEMVAEVSQERGALPMLAFAAARLWEHRDREEGLLTREAYEHIGGVAGALAQHAEATLEKIGQDQVPIVRELFRNLVTAQGTRAARTRNELLSVFGSTADVGAPLVGAREGASPSPTAGAVLDTLIDARLLTSYEVPTEDDEGSPQQRIEIIHESLLVNWPRLVRWQAQDEEGAILRDQLRQAAQMWEERGHPEDLLWTGTSFNEYQLWRERYAGGLSTAEEEFALAMTAKAERRKRQRRLAIASVITLLAIGLGIVGAFWRQAVAASQRAEANQLLALGRLEIESNPTGALAYALASLERADEEVTRLFAVEAFWRGPPARMLSLLPPYGRSWVTWLPTFSPDGRWLVALGAEESASFDHFLLWSRAGGEPQRIDTTEHVADIARLDFGSTPDRIVTRSWPSHRIGIWSLPDGRLLRTLPTEGPIDFRMAGDPQRIVTFNQKGSGVRVQSWPLGDGEPRLLRDLAEANLGGYSTWQNTWALDVSSDASRFAYVPYSEPLGRQITLLSAKDASRPSRRLVGSDEDHMHQLAFHPGGARLAGTGRKGFVQVWGIEDSEEPAYRTLQRPLGAVYPLRFDDTGRHLAAGMVSGLTAWWNLDWPPDAAPTVLSEGSFQQYLAFHPQGDWLVRGGAIWPLTRPVPLDLLGHEDWVTRLAFLPDGKWLASTSEDGTLRLWPLSPETAGAHRVLFDTGGLWLRWVGTGPRGSELLIGVSNGEIWLVPVDGYAPRLLGSFEGPSSAGVLTSTTAAACRGDELRVWDLATGVETTLAEGDPENQQCDLVAAPDGRLISGDWVNGLRRWDPAAGSYETLSESFGFIDLSPDGRFLLAQNQVGDAPSLLDLETGVWTHLAGHGASGCAALDPTGRIAATLREGSVLQVGPADGTVPHLLVEDGNGCPVISPDGRWIAQPWGDDRIRLWPMPDMSQPPLHTLPHDELLAKLRTLTNLRVVEDPESETGWGWALDPFPGWEHVPTW